MIRINLLPEELRDALSRSTALEIPALLKQKKIRWGLSAVLGGQVLILAFLLFQIPWNLRFQKELDTLKAEHQDTLKQKTETRVIEAKLKNLKNLTAHRFYWTRVLNEISNAVPEGIWLRTLATGTDKDPSLKLDGSVIAPGQETARIGQFIHAMKAGPALGSLFEHIELLNVSQKRYKDLDVYEFALALVWKKEST